MCLYSPNVEAHCGDNAVGRDALSVSVDGLHSLKQRLEEEGGNTSVGGRREEAHRRSI